LLSLRVPLRLPTVHSQVHWRAGALQRNVSRVSNVCKNAPLSQRRQNWNIASEPSSMTSSSCDGIETENDQTDAERGGYVRGALLVPR
jgi:hypothetical protein